jgi:soluble lytic murein transglycosylase
MIFLDDEMSRFFRRIQAVSLFFACMVIPAGAGADIYRWVDENGVLHYSDAPSVNAYFPHSGYMLDGYSTDRYDSIIRQAARRYNLDFELVKAIVKVESNFNPRAVSRSGALGLMQIMPFNLGPLDIENPYNPWQNIMGGSRFFRQILNRFNGDVKLALAGYNAGPNSVARYGGIPPFRETVNYVRKVMRCYRRYKRS